MPTLFISRLALKVVIRGVFIYLTVRYLDQVAEDEN